eukprot:222383_1
MTSRSFQRKLKALEFPIWNKFNIENLDHIKTLVVYLEQTKMRELKVSQRVNLKNTKDKNWLRSFADYLDRIEDCPYQLKDKMEPNDWVEVIEWLISQAITREYHDKKDEYNRRTPIRRVERREYALTQCESEECEQAMKDLCGFLNIPPNENKVITAQTLYNFIKTKFSLSSITNYEASIALDNDDHKTRDRDMLRKRYGQQHDPWKSLRSVDDILKFYGVNGHMGNYLGFSTGDKAVDAAAIILRVLYVLDVRQSQNQLNEIVTFLQRFTANPKTNPNLGKV